MENKSLQILQNVKDITVEIINLIGEENDAIIAKNFNVFKSILSRKYNLMRSYDDLSLELSEVVEDLKKTNAEELEALVDLTKKLNDACDVNTKLLSHEQEIALNANTAFLLGTNAVVNTLNEDATDGAWIVQDYINREVSFIRRCNQPGRFRKGKKDGQACGIGLDGN